MEEKEPELFIEKITINEVRHLKDVEITISSEERKHLILTGKNGSGKTSVLEEIRDWVNNRINKISENEDVSSFGKEIKSFFEGIDLKMKSREDGSSEIEDLLEEKAFIFPQKKIEADNLRDQIFKELSKFRQALVLFYDDLEENEEKERAKRIIKRSLKIQAPFTAFKYWIVKENPTFITDFQTLLPT